MVCENIGYVSRLLIVHVWFDQHRRSTIILFTCQLVVTTAMPGEGMVSSHEINSKKFVMSNKEHHPTIAPTITLVKPYVKITVTGN